MFLPLKDHNPLENIRSPWMTRSLIILTSLLWLVFQMSPEQLEASLAYMLIPAVLLDGAILPPGYESIPEPVTLITYAFMHGSFLHLAGNMLFLWVFGDNVEDAMGHIPFLFFYILCAVAGGLTHALTMPSSEAPLVGASAAVAGCVAAYLLLHPYIRIWVLMFMRLPLNLPAWIPLGVWILFQGYMLWSGTDPHTAWAAHLGGMAAGAVLILVMRRPGVELFDRSL